MNCPASNMSRVRQRGDAIFFDSFIPHRSYPNSTEEPRRVLYVTYNAASAGDIGCSITPTSARVIHQTANADGEQYAFRV